MLFFVDSDKKLIIGYSPKCGCTHVKSLIRALYPEKFGHVVHLHKEIPRTRKLPTELSEYTVIFVTRNPLDRLVSGFFQKYKHGEPFRHAWSVDPPTFREFVHALLDRDWKRVDKHHFEPQTTGVDWRRVQAEAKCWKLYDITAIDYAFLCGLFGTTPDAIDLSFRGNHVRKVHRSRSSSSIPLYEQTIDDVYGTDYTVADMFDTELQTKVQTFFQEDRLFIQSGKDPI